MAIGAAVLLALGAYQQVARSDSVPRPPSDEQSFSCTVVSVTDGDTLRCINGTRIRIAAIAARETDESCREGHPCPLASGASAKRELSRLTLGRRLSCEPTGRNYNRVAAFCRTSAGTEISCAMVAGGYAAPWERFGYGARCRNRWRPADDFASR